MPENRLAHEKSPYLLQHAHNPVDWYPWGEEAFEAARRKDRPVFLSIGYSTCHWCHVMERESFDNDEVAALLNRAFVAVKVDREERPDVDAVYMAVCQALTGAGGWPLTILMTPEQKPFWAGTYLPPRGRFGQPGLLELLAQVDTLWRTGREGLLYTGEEITSHLLGKKTAAGATPSRSVLHNAVALFRRSFDAQNGGFGGAPKFPLPHNLIFLMEYARLEGSTEALWMAEQTLTRMARGGIFDQLGGGFSRYSTDVQWLAPHFEKMLYDNALLAYAYLEAFEQTGRKLYKRIAEQTLDYVLRELTGEQGEFFCGQDADSDGEEGKYYLFTPQEVRQLLGAVEGERFCRWYDVTEVGNFEGKSIPNLLDNDEYDSEPPGMEGLRQTLRVHRSARAALHCDDKALTAWNGLMIAALAKAARVTGRGDYLQAACRARTFVQSRLTAPDGRLWLRWRDGEAAVAGQLDDYAFYGWALLELYAVAFDVSCMQEAVRLAEALQRHFWDEKDGGFFLTAADAQQLIARPKEVYDGAIPSGNSMAGLLLVRLGSLTGETRWRALADRQLTFLAGSAEGYPTGYSAALLALCEALYPSRELVCTSADGIPDGLGELSAEKRLRTVLKTPQNARALAGVARFTENYPLPDSGAAFYLCLDGACAAPVYGLDALKALL